MLTISASSLVLTGFETQNKYKIRNSLGQQVYFAAESQFSRASFRTHFCSKKYEPTSTIITQVFTAQDFVGHNPQNYNKRHCHTYTSTCLSSIV